MGVTTIEWTDESLNPLRARAPNGKSGHHCVKVSPGCKNCYSSRFQPRLGLPVFQEQRRDPPELFLDSKTLLEPLKRRQPTKFFWCDMTDMFGEWVPFEWIAACFGVMATTPRHTHQVLTKRPERSLEFFEWLASEGSTVPALVGAEPGPGESVLTAAAVMYADQRTDYSLSRDYKDPQKARRFIEAVQRPWPLPNVWLGVSVEDQQRADERIPKLLRCPAAVRFLSCEPLLGPVDLRPYVYRGSHQVCPRCMFATNQPLEACPNDGTGLGPDIAIDWVIVGGESGPGARPLELEWVRSLVSQCRAAGTACFVKQFGARPRDPNGLRSPDICARADGSYVLADRKGGDLSELYGRWPREFPT